MDTIKSSAEISGLFASGRRVKGSYLTLIIRSCAVGNKTEGVEQHGRNGRVAFIAGKKLGNAVWRNAAKRRMRAMCRDLGGPWVGYDVIFLAKSSITGASYSKVLKACDKMLGNSPLGNGSASDG
ncbi:ribonuclease P protein component [Adlercreutzia sp. ZJ242]|uniref:ribonuclease P protein component n=1 Tax=Adlercreutzia sp. ZJ242 TaxID=2709409 RepID=UPI0013ECE262|nr:ribonuclease P protein component [Adlercreutzia sp. ZJ242]